MSLSKIDIVIIFLYIVFTFLIGIAVSRKKHNSFENFYLADRKMPWWLIGFSMAATNFSIDTPLVVNKIIYEYGLPGMWFQWSNLISAMLVAFILAPLWRRANIITDVEFIELRYSGKAASALRLIKGIYFGLILNTIIMGWVFIALLKILTHFANIDPMTIAVIAVLLVFIYSCLSGYLGIALTDTLQYPIALAGSFMLAVFAVKKVGGMNMLLSKLSVVQKQSPIEYTSMFPKLDMGSFVTLFVLSCLLIQWWSNYNADGGGKHIQRILSAKNEKHAVGGVLFFSIMTYVVQLWPWIITALCSIILLNDTTDPEKNYAVIISEVLPVGCKGFVLAGLIGAFMSTIDTHLNLGASYISRDIYKRFLIRNGSEHHYIRMSQVFMLIMLIMAVMITYCSDSVFSVLKFILVLSSGTGLVIIMRWFWWRINVWSELSAILTSSMAAVFLKLFVSHCPYYYQLTISVLVSSIVWIPVTLLTRPVQEATLREFVERFKPLPFGWRKIYVKYSIDMPRNPFRPVLNWILSVIILVVITFVIKYLLVRSA